MAALGLMMVGLGSSLVLNPQKNIKSDFLIGSMLLLMSFRDGFLLVTLHVSVNLLYKVLAFADSSALG